MCYLQRPRLPVELQWEIALWLKDTPDIHSRYALMSKNFYKWFVKFSMFWKHASLTAHRLLPYLYPQVHLMDTDIAAKFVDFMLVRGMLISRMPGMGRERRDEAADVDRDNG